MKNYLRAIHTAVGPIFVFGLLMLGGALFVVKVVPSLIERTVKGAAETTIEATAQAGGLILGELTNAAKAADVLQLTATRELPLVITDVTTLPVEGHSTIAVSYTHLTLPTTPYV